ncbi:MAG: hypothetical protein LBT32_01220, partial [Peptococcaceae bacterium]|nr:hypothetical protein [Peptococcaceae bacterium]
MTGVDIANTIISFETRSDPLTVELWRVDPGGAPEMRVFSLREERADLRQFIQGAVLVGHDLAKQVSLLEYHMGEEFSNERWDVFTLARIFFPGCHERGLNALAQSVYAHVGKSADPLPSSAAGLSWYLLQACWQKGLGFDLSFYAALDPLTSGWAGKGFADALHREVRRRFPDRPLRLDLGLAAPEDGLFQKPDAGKEALPPAEWVAACFAPQGLLEQRIVGFESRAG